MITTDFRIIDEQEINFGHCNQLWSMIIKDGERFAIEVNTRHELLGRKYTVDRKQAELLLREITNKIAKCGSHEVASELMKLGFSYKSICEMMFVINTRYLFFDFNNLCKLRAKYKYTSFPAIEDLIWENKEFGKRISITFPGRTSPIGWFTPVTDEDGSDFFVELNPDFHKKH
ncbi:MAG: hypothetical protein JST26_09740 [Bacteroidetes bacterium]|nr:hypothetical protein [Bacteroidota bacterium]